LFKETEIESRISMEKPAFNKKKAIFHQQIWLTIKEETINRYIQKTRIVKLGHFGK
jgi:hypothetical protein